MWHRLFFEKINLTKSENLSNVPVSSLKIRIMYFHLKDAILCEPFEYVKYKPMVNLGSSVDTLFDKCTGNRT